MALGQVVSKELQKSHNNNNNNNNNNNKDFILRG